MLKTLLVAWREFSSTVFAKGFIIGVLMTPVIIAVVVGAIALTKNLKGPQIVGSIAVIDKTGGVAAGIEKRFTREALEKEKKEMTEKISAAARDQAQKLGLPEGQVAGADAATKQAMEQALVDADLSVEVLASDADQAREKEPLARTNVHAREASKDGPRPRIALVVIPPPSVTPDSTGGYADFELFTAPKLDFEIQERIERKIADAIVDARIQTDGRFRTSGVDADAVRAILKRPEAKTVTVTSEGEKKSTGAFQMLIPMAFMLLLLISVMTGGQYLLTSTVEEKSSRVMEVLLSAISPLQLMLGKIIGQMCVGLLILVVYGGVGITGLIVFSLMHILDPILLVYLFVFFFIAFFIIASLMAAAGAAVSEMREAQTLMTPIMVIIMLPWLLWMPISRAPNSLFATIMSFVPGINPFVMMIRLTGSEPPPVWQIPVSILIGLGTVVFCSWAAAKIFRIGVLLYGKPPNFRTLVKWVRMA